MSAGARGGPSPGTTIDRVSRPTRQTYARVAAATREADRRDRFIDAGLTVFTTTGFVTSSVAQICKQAGLSTRQYYQLFSDRADLLVAIHAMVNERAQEAVAEVLAGPVGDLDELLIAAIAAYVTAITADSRYPSIAFIEIVGVNAHTEEHRRRIRDQWISALNVVAQRYADAGRLPARDYRMTWIAMAGAVNALVQEYSESGSTAEGLEALSTELSRLLLVGLLRD